MQIRQNLVAESKYSLKCPHSMTPVGICVHNTANDAPAANEINYMISNSNSTSFHIAVDDKEAVQGLPLNRNGWHAGDGADGEGNRKHIGVEICYSKSGGEKFDQAENNAAILIAQLLKERGWGIDRVKRHKDFSGKNCPQKTMELGWDRFLKKVQAQLGGSMDCLISNNDDGKKLFAKLVHNSDLADGTVKLLELADKADNVSLETVQKSLAARDGKLNSCTNLLATRDTELAKANQEVSNREEQIGRLKADSLQREELLKDDIIKLKKQLENQPVEDSKWQAAYEQEHTKYLEEAKAKGIALNDLAVANARIKALEDGVDNDDRKTVYKLLRQLLERILGK